MIRRTIAFFAGLAIVTTLLAACGGGATVVGVEQSGAGAAAGPQRIEHATEVLKFDPASIPAGDREPVAGSCAGSAIVPGAYRCEPEDSPAEPCFALSGAQLGCRPNPVTRRYEVLVRPSNSLPPVAPPAPDQLVPFFVELDGDLTCEIRTGPEPVIIGGVSALYDCETPYTYLLGFDKDAPVWEAALYTLDPDTGESPSGKVPMPVRRAWVP